MKFENLLAEIDGFGKYQFLMVLLLVIPRCTLPAHFLLNNFIAAVPDHRCDISGLDGGDTFVNLTQDQRLRISIPAQEDGTPSSCKMFRSLSSTSCTTPPTPLRYLQSHVKMDGCMTPAPSPLL
ncbi:hypothetical protein AAFF_G00198720 [Aldrovandia affinis]|uniref:Uncharacterized protein n=1 Tax=Aldrovandia affinis TaxID=143900 RepID=A0AAD7RL72_9TELE|nr:hypothetical protein AAFF_G00198720 [Aldrovandia affinis]